MSQLPGLSSTQNALSRMVSHLVANVSHILQDVVILS